MAQIEIRNISKFYAIGSQTITAVNEVSLSVEKGDFLSVVGHSGSGKTTLLSVIGGLTRPTGGSVIYEGRDIASFDDMTLSAYRNENIGFIFQFASLLPMLTARENVLLPVLFSRKVTTDAGARALDCLDLVGLADRADAYPSQLSGGQQRRVAIARSLMNEPEVILADEPTGDLDEETEAEVMGLFRTLNQEKKVTLILITHNSDLAGQAGRKFRMTKGALTEVV